MFKRFSKFLDGFFVWTLHKTNALLVPTCSHFVYFSLLFLVFVAGITKISNLAEIVFSFISALISCVCFFTRKRGEKVGFYCYCRATGLIFRSSMCFFEKTAEIKKRLSQIACYCIKFQKFSRRHWKLQLIYGKLLSVYFSSSSFLHRRGSWYRASFLLFKKKKKR